MATPREITKEYARQIAEAVKNDPTDLYVAVDLLEEFGAKAYREGRREIVEQIAKYGRDIV